MLETSASEITIPAQTRLSPWNPLVSLGRYWRCSLPTGIVLASIAVYATLRSFEPHYRATSLLEASNYIQMFMGVMPTPITLDVDEIMSASVLEPILADPNLRTAPRLADPRHAEANLRKNLSVDFAGLSWRMLVSYEDTDPIAAALVCNAVAASYRRQRDVLGSANLLVRSHWSEIELWKSEVEQRRRAVTKPFDTSS